LERGGSSAVGRGRARHGGSSALGRGRAQPQPTALLPPCSNSKTRSCYSSCRAPDDGREDAQNMLSCAQTSSNKLEELLHLVG